MKDKAAPDTISTQVANAALEARSGRRALTFDAARYEAMIQAADIPEEQQQEYLGLMWNIIVSCVDLGIEVKIDAPEGQSCGQSTDLPIDLDQAVLECLIQHQITNTFTAASSPAVKESIEEEEV